MKINSYNSNLKINKKDSLAKKHTKINKLNFTSNKTEQAEPVDLSKNKFFNPELKEYLDKHTFLYNCEDGKVRNLNVLQILEQNTYPLSDVDMEMYHSTPSKEIAQKIIKEGFNTKYISRTMFGPGFYFSPSQADAMNYYRAILKADCKGKCAKIKTGFYSDIWQKELKNEVSKLTRSIPGYKSNIYFPSNSEKITNEYIRTLLCDMGYDFGYGSNGRTHCYVAFNPDAITNIQLV